MVRRFTPLRDNLPDVARPTEVIALTGATGQLGGRVARRLAQQGAPVRLVVRDPSRAPALPGTGIARAEFSDAGAMRAALDGARTLLLVSASEAQDRVAQHTTAIDAAVSAGVARIVYLSFLGAAPDATFTFARDHWHTEQYLRGTGVPFTALRDSLYLDLLVEFVGADGVLRGPAGQGRVAPVCRDDVADVVAAVLLESGLDGEVLDVTGPEAVTLGELTEAIGEAAGRPVRYQPETLDEAYASRAGSGVPGWMVDGWVSTYTAIAAGELAVVSDTVRRLTGHAPLGVRDYLRAHPAAVAGLRG
jgi:NAD(P)H dehydrogenase (quinone)